MSGLIPREFLDEILQRTDLVELINSYVPLKKRGNSFLACCPFHHEKTPSFNVGIRKQFYHCFGCGVSGNAISFIMNHLGKDFVDTVELLASRLGLAIPESSERKKTIPRKNLHQLLEKLTLYYQQILRTKGESAVTYLKNRGITGAIAKQFQLGFSLADWSKLSQTFQADKQELINIGMIIQKENGNCYDRYRQRIMFPIHDRQGRLIGFGGRVIDDTQKPKYLNSPESIIFQKNRELYGLYQATKEKGTLENIIIVEGYLDVIALSQNGITNSVATLGTATSPFHIQLLLKYTQQIIFCFDGDQAGRQAAWKALEVALPSLENGLDVRFVFLPEGEDPDSLVRIQGRAVFLERIAAAIPLHRYFIDALIENLDLSNPAGKTQLVANAKPYLSKLPEGSYKQLLIDELSRLTRIENHRIAQLVNVQALGPEIKTNPISRSPLRLAIALLLQSPQLYFSCKELLNIHALDMEGLNLIRQIIEQIEDCPQITTAGLIEHWRHSDLFNSMLKLATWDHLVPEEALEKEFTDIIQFLQKQALEIKINHYLDKSRKEGLDASEKQTLQTLVQERHTINKMII